MTIEDLDLLDVGFDLDDYGNPRVSSPAQSIANLLANMFIIIPSTYPSMPSTGLNIQRWMSAVLEEDIDVNELKEAIQIQCKSVAAYVDIDGIEAYSSVTNGATAVIFITIPVRFSDEIIYMGFQQDSETQVLNYDFLIKSKEM